MRLISIELNELSPVLMDKFIAAGKLPNFARLREQSRVYLTDAEEAQEDLEPWIQWVTVHSGLSYAEHGIKNLGEGKKLGRKCVWDVVSDAGKSVWVCGSMNIDYQLPINGWVLPDPWTRDVKPHPEEELHPYHRFVSANVQEYTREDVPLSRRDQLAFLGFMARHGLRPSTVAAIVRQLAEERSADAHWKRAVILDRLQFDLFRSRWRRARPDFATFFLNSTAHFQHLYWRNMEPEHFKVKPEPGEQAVYEDAILFGYEQMDRICGELLELAGDDTMLVFNTALSQQPCLTYEDEGGKRIYRPHDFDQFLSTVGVERTAAVSPVMAEEFHVGFASEDDAQAAESKLSQVRYEERPALRVDRQGSDLMCGCQIWDEVESDASLRLDGNGRSVPFFDLFYKIDLVKSGMHHPQGMLWIRDLERTHEEHPVPVPLTTVAPTILDALGVERPAHMREDALTR